MAEGKHPFQVLNYNKTAHQDLTRGRRQAPSSTVEVRQGRASAAHMRATGAERPSHSVRSALKPREQEAQKGYLLQEESVHSQSEIFLHASHLNP